jgi:hypothetical protein
MAVEAARGGSDAWGVTSSWRGDLKLFARIVERASQLIGETAQPTPCRIEFAVRDDLERYHSVQELLDRAPAGTLRSFTAARIRVGETGLYAEVCFGRKATQSDSALKAPPGVLLVVHSDGTVQKEVVERIRNELSVVVARGGFPRSRAPTTGPEPSGADWETALSERWRLRQTYAQAIFGGITILVLLAAYVVYTLLSAHEGEGFDGHLDSLGLPAYSGGVFVVAQIVSFPMSNFLFPAIEIADVTPGRRLVQIVGRSGVVTATVGVAGAYFRSHVG